MTDDVPPFRSAEFADRGSANHAFWYVGPSQDGVEIELTVHAGGDAHVVMDVDTARAFANAVLWVTESRP